MEATISLDLADTSRATQMGGIISNPTKIPGVNRITAILKL